MWFHTVLTTYGAWLHGDARGFRTRHHREHVEGDYKNPPPPGMYEERARRSRELQKYPTAMLEKPLREFVGLAIKDKLERGGCLVIAIAVSGKHVHILVKIPRGRPRDWAGVVKRHVWFELRAIGRAGKLWAKGAKEVPVRDRAHQLNAYRYIARHRGQGAWVWLWTERRR